MTQRTPWLIALVLACIAGCGDDATKASSPDASVSHDAGVDAGSCDSCTLREAAERAGIRFGVAAAPMDDPKWNDLIVTEFDALSPEGELVWKVIHPAPDEWAFDGADRVLAFTEENDLSNMVSHFAWDQATATTGTPAWVEDITDPGELEKVMREHLRTLSKRYGKKIDRWIAVNEPLVYTGTGALFENHFFKTFGPDYIAKVFQIAADEAPDSELWLNEIFTEGNAPKCDALVALARDLVDRGIPIDGVGIQGHLFLAMPDFELVERTMRRLGELGLKVAVTELDAPVDPTVADQLGLQAERMAHMVRACLAVPRCESVTVWGLHDGVSWLNTLLKPGMAPLLFDAKLERKPSYYAVRDALAEGRPR